MRTLEVNGSQFNIGLNNLYGVVDSVQVGNNYVTPSIRWLTNNTDASLMEKNGNVVTLKGLNTFLVVIEVNNSSSEGSILVDFYGGNYLTTQQTILNFETGAEVSKVNITQTAVFICAAPNGSNYYLRMTSLKGSTKTIKAKMLIMCINL